MELHIIFTEAGMYLSKARFDSWREIQAQFTDFKASLGPWERDAVVEYLAFDYPDLAPSAATQVEALLGADSSTRQLTFD